MYKSVILAVSALAGLGYAQTVPTCAQACVVPPASCNLVDISCICNDSEWIASVACCVFSSCPDDSDRQQALQYGNTVCNPVGATLPTTTSSCPASTGTSSATGTDAAASASSVLSSVSSASSAAASSAFSSALSSVSTTASGGASTSSALATKIAVADGVGIAGALLGIAALL